MPIDRSSVPDPARCPLCGGPNACGVVDAERRGEPASSCWCMRTPIPADLRAQVPPASRGSCICARCAAAAQEADDGTEPAS